MNPKGKEAQRQEQHVLETLCREYEILCQIDLSADTYVCDYRKPQENTDGTADFPGQGKFSEALAVYVQRRVWPEDRKIFDALISKKILTRQLRTDGTVRVRYRGSDGNSRKMYEMQVIAGTHGENPGDTCGSPAVMTIRRVDIFLADEENIKKELLQRFEKEERRELTVLHRALHTGVWTAVFDQDRKLVKSGVGDSLRLMLDIPQADQLPRTKEEWKRRVRPEEIETIREKFCALLASREKEPSLELECELRTDWGEYRWFRVYGCRFPEENGGYRITGVLTDINEEHRIRASKADGMHRMRSREGELEAVIARLRQESLEKSEFLTRISHDIRTPVNGIKGLLAMAKTHADDREMVVDTLTKAENAELLLEILVDDILHMSQSVKNDPFYHGEVTDLLELLKSSREVFLGEALHKGLVVHPGRVEVKHPKVYANGHYLKRIWLNLINCCIKYNQEGGSIERWIIETPINSSHSMYTFILRDSGGEINKEFMQEIVAPLTRSEIGREDIIQKTGLSMVVTRELAELIGGTVDVRNEPGAGTIFTFKIPMEICPEAGSEPQPDAGTSDADDTCEGELQGKRILIAEDNELNLEILQYFLGKRGAQLLTVRDGKEAVEAFRRSEEGSIDLILMDIMMPVMDGLEETRLIRDMERADAAAVPILAMTANAFAEDVKNTKEAGMNEHLSKPLNMPKVMQCMNRYLKK